MSMSVRGLASGLDVDNIIEQLIALERKPIALMQKKQLRVEAQQGAWRDINTRLKTLSDKLGALKLSSTYLAKSATVGDEKIIKASASSSAVAATYDVTVTELATVSSAYSGKLDTEPSVAMQAQGSLRITMTGATPADVWEIQVDPQDSLNKLVEKINKTTKVEGEKTKAIPVQASIINNQLVITSKTSGEAGRFTMTTSANPGDNLGEKLKSITIKDGLDAQLTVNGIQLRSGSNSVTSIPGVTLTLQSKGTTKVTIDNDTSTTVKAVQELVDQYNSVMDFMNTKLEKTKGDLRGDSTLIGLQSTVRRMLTSQASYASGKYVTLADIGIGTAKFDKNAPDYSGKLSLDTAKLEAALKADPLAVKAILYTETNVAQGKTASGTSLDNSRWPITTVTDGITDSTLWDHATAPQGWASADLTTPQTLTIDLGGTKTLEKVKLFTIDGRYAAKDFGVKDYKLFYEDEKGVSHEVANVTNNTQASLTHYLNSVEATRLRFEFAASNEGTPGSARVLEVEAYENSGVAYNLEQYLESFIRSGDGILAEKQKSFTSEIDDIKDQIERMEDRLVRKQEMLVRQYTALEKALGSMQNQGNWLSSQIGSLPKYNTGE